MEAAEDLISKGSKEIIIVSSMFTPGGSHSEIEIPEEIKLLKAKFPSVIIDYAWPFDLKKIAKFLEEQIRCFIPTSN